MMTIQAYKDYYRALQPEQRAAMLRKILRQIETLESFYMTDGENSYVSREFKEAAFREREDLCLRTSALYSLQREEGER